MTIRQKMILVTIGILTVIGLIIALIILPTARDILKISDAIHLERVDLEKKYQRGQLLRETIDNFDKIKNREADLKNVFLTKGQELGFITKLEQIAAQHNLEQEIRLQIPDNMTKEFTEIPLVLNIRGSYSNIVRYLKSLEQESFYYPINTWKLNAVRGGDASPESPIITAVFTGNIVLYQPELN